jgi:hypothetical protein
VKARAPALRAAGLITRSNTFEGSRGVPVRDANTCQRGRLVRARPLRAELQPTFWRLKSAQCRGRLPQPLALERRLGQICLVAMRSLERGRAASPRHHLRLLSRDRRPSDLAVGRQGARRRGNRSRADAGRGVDGRSRAPVSATKPSSRPSESTHPPRRPLYLSRCVLLGAGSLSGSVLWRPFAAALPQAHILPGDPKFTKE